MAKKIVVAVVALALVCVAAIALPIVGVFWLTQPVVTAGDAFIGALRDGDYARAYELCSDDLQTELENVRGLETLITNVQPVTWNFSSRSINDTGGDTDNEGQLTGDVTFSAERTGHLELTLTFEDEQWKVAGFNFQET
jgi:hypothetical protein